MVKIVKVAQTDGQIKFIIRKIVIENLLVCNQLYTAMILPVKTIDQELCLFEEKWVSIETIAVQVTRVVVHNNFRS